MKPMNQLRKYGPQLVVAGASLLPLLSHAAIDTTAATTGITDVQTALLAVIAAVTTMVIAIWGAVKVFRFFGKK